MNRAEEEGEREREREQLYIKKKTLIDFSTTAWSEKQKRC